MAIKFAILGLLHYKDMHGYRIKQHIERNFGHMWSINYGQIYPNLRQLLDDGFVSMKRVNQVGEKGPDRKLYSLTDQGKEEFARWLDSSPERLMLLRDPFLLRFVFFGFGDNSRAVEIIDEQIGLYEEQLKTRNENLEHWHTHDKYVRLITQLGIDLNEMFLNWLKKAKDEILAESDEATHSRDAVVSA